jgi:hypothetical protein
MRCFWGSRSRFIHSLHDDSEEMKSDMRSIARVLFFVLAIVVAGSVLLTEVMR